MTEPYLRLLPWIPNPDDPERPIVLVPEDLHERFPPAWIQDPNLSTLGLVPSWPDTLISQSSYNSFVDCNRSWGWDKLEGIKKPEKPATKRGKEHHTQLENWGRDATPPTADFDRLLPALQYFPDPKVGLQEEYFALLVDDVVFHGFVDWETDEEIFDLKTAKDLCWAKTQAGLLKDVQASVYALKKIVQNNLTQATCRWVYTQMEGGRYAHPVEVVFTKKHAIENVVSYLPQAREMIAHKKSGKKALDLAPNWGHCSAYGGCPYTKLCVVTGKNHFMSLLKQDKTKNERKLLGMDLKDKIKADLAAKNKTMPSAGGQLPVQKPAEAKAEEKKVAAPTTTKPVTTAAKPVTTTPKQQGNTGTIAQATQAAAAGKKTSLMAGAKTVSAAVAAKAVTGVNPPDASPDPRTKTETKAAEEKVETEPKKATVVTKQKESVSKLTGSGTGLGFCLLVDCLPQKTAVENVDSFIRPLQQELERVSSVEHYRLIDFNKGPAMLAAGVRDHLKEKPQGMFIVDSRALDPEVLAVLIECADQVVRGVR